MSKLAYIIDRDENVFLFNLDWDSWDTIGEKHPHIYIFSCGTYEFKDGKVIVSNDWRAPGSCSYSDEDTLMKYFGMKEI